MERKQAEAYPETNLSTQLLQHQQQMLKFLFFTNYDIIYQTFQLKHGSYADRNRGRIATTFKSQQIAKHYEIASQKNHIRILRDDIDLDKQLGKLQTLWHNRNIPYFHRYYFLKMLMSCYFKNLQPNIQQEDHLVRSEQHLYYPLFKSINAREACLRNVRRLLAELSPQDVYEYLHTAKERLGNEKRKNQREKYQKQGYKLKLTEATYEGKISKTKFQIFSDSFNHLTKLTLYVVELIVKWKEYLGSLTHDARKQKERMEYYFYDDNYYLKILTDLGFLKVSFLSQFYRFAPKNDPFLLQSVLAFETAQQKTLDHELLKAIFMPQKEHLAQILTVLQLLSEQYRYNIRSRKVFDLNVLKQPALRAQEKHYNNDQRAELSNLVLKKIQSPLAKKSKSVATFRVREGVSSKKEAIVVEFKRRDSPGKDSPGKESPGKESPGGRKKVASLPGSVEKTVLDRDKGNPFRNSIILQKNASISEMSSVDMNLISVLKQQIIKKVREEFELHKARDKKRGESKGLEEQKEELQVNKGVSLQKDTQALELFIDSKVNQTMKKIFPFQPEKQVKLPLQFSPRKISEVEVAVQLENMFRKAVGQYRDMQYNQVDLLRIIEQTEYVYLLVGRIGDQEVGRVICALEKTVTDFKVLKILYLHFVEKEDIDMLVLKFVEFLWEYENCFEIHYNFLQPAGHQAIKQLLQGIQKTMEQYSMVGRKQVYSTVMQVKFIFKRQNKNVNYLPNPYPFALHLQFSILVAAKKLMLENKNEHKHLELLNYDYFLMQAIKKLLTAQDILTLKERVTWKNRLKLLIDMLKDEEEADLMLDQLHQIDAPNVSDINNTLAKIHQPFLEVSDLVKNNRLTLLSTSFTLTPDYPIKTINHGPTNQFYRLSIMASFPLQLDSNGTEFYLLPVKDNPDYYLLVFSAKDYLNTYKSLDLSLNEYLTSRITKKEEGLKKVQRVINSLWIPMVRFPSKYKQREEVFIHTVRVLDLVPLKMDVVIGQHLQWLCNMEMENSIQFEQHESDQKVDFPIGVGVVSAISRAVIYARIFH